MRVTEWPDAPKGASTRRRQEVGRVARSFLARGVCPAEPLVRMLLGKPAALPQESE